jgi:septum formation protein
MAVDSAVYTLMGTNPRLAFQASQPALVLASGSETRRALLASTGLSFTAFAPDVDETAVKVATRRDGGTPEASALTLARLKAQAYRGEDALVIGCDQILVCDGVWFDKPPTMDAARLQLQTLRGRPHVLVTATVLYRGGQKVWTHLAKPKLTMRTFTAGFLETYMAAEGEALLHSVGGYRVEGLGMQLFEAIEGDQSAILGLPLLPLLSYFRTQGIILG